MDEVHYLADRFRGAVWEEVIIHLPAVGAAGVAVARRCRTPRSSATGCRPCAATPTSSCREDRPVPLEQHMLVASEAVRPVRRRRGRRRRTEVQPRALRHRARHGGRRSPRGRSRTPGGDRGGGRRRRAIAWSAPDVVERARPRSTCCRRSSSSSAGPAATRPCGRCSRAGIRLTEPRGARRDPRDRRGARRARCPTRTWRCSATGSGSTGLERGVAAHHAGMLPAFKEVVEELFQRSSSRSSSRPRRSRSASTCRPARVVLEKLEKFNGEARVDRSRRGSTPSSPAGPAGAASTSRATPSSSGADGLDPRRSPALASRRTYPLNSSFRPTYNMAVNLVDQFGARAHGRSSSLVRAVPGRPAVVGLARTGAQAGGVHGRLRARRWAATSGDFGEYFGHPARASASSSGRHSKGNSDARTTRDDGSESSARLARRCRRIRATAAPTASSTRGGRSGGGGCKQEHDQLSGRSARAPDRSRSGSTGSPRCSSSSATSSAIGTARSSRRRRDAS